MSGARGVGKSVEAAADSDQLSAGREAVSVFTRYTVRDQVPGAQYPKILGQMANAGVEIWKWAHGLKTSVLAYNYR